MIDDLMQCYDSAPTFFGHVSLLGMVSNFGLACSCLRFSPHPFNRQ